MVLEVERLEREIDAAAFAVEAHDFLCRLGLPFLSLWRHFCKQFHGNHNLFILKNEIELCIFDWYKAHFKGNLQYQIIDTYTSNSLCS